MLNLTQKLLDGASLDTAEIEAAIPQLLQESVPDADKAAFLTALAHKGESPEEIAAFASAFLDLAVRPDLSRDSLQRPLIDVCGTGGDKLGLFNVSTASVFLLAAAGAAVVKHGNRGITSPSGGADVLEALGIRIDLPPQDLGRCLEEVGAAFLFAPAYHPAYKAIVPVRKALAEQGQRTVFNLLGPLLNPVRPEHQLIGVYDAALGEPFAKILGQLGRRRAWAVHGVTEDGQGMDEVSTMGDTRVWTCNEGALDSLTLTPATCGFSRARAEDLRGGSAEDNAALTVKILSGDETGPITDIVLFNAAASIHVAGLAGDLGEALGLARQTIQDKTALQVLRRWQAFA